MRGRAQSLKQRSRQGDQGQSGKRVFAVESITLCAPWIGFIWKIMIRKDRERRKGRREALADEEFRRQEWGHRGHRVVHNKDA